jgi:NADH:ubiquinone oxidoreductase subunit F (NADH-binding)
LLERPPPPPARRIVLVQSRRRGAIRELIEVHGGGVREGRVVKAVIVGASIALLPAEVLDTAIDFESLGAVSSGLGVFSSSTSSR